MPAESKQISESIERPAADVYRYASDPANLPAWAPGLGSSVENIDGRWFVETPAGPAGFAFVERNEPGVLDHELTLPSAVARPAGKPSHPLLLGAGLDCGRVVLTPDPVHGRRRRLAREHGHAGKDGTGAAKTTHRDASNLDHVAAASPRERRHDLIGSSVAISREPEVRPLDHLGGPGR